MILSNRIHSSLLKLDIIKVEKHRETKKEKGNCCFHWEILKVKLRYHVVTIATGISLCMLSTNQSFHSKSEV